MKNYLRYSLELALYFPLCYVAFLKGGWAPILAVLMMTASQVIADAVLPEDRFDPQIKHPRVLDAMLMLHLPAGLLVLALLLWYVAPGDLWGLRALCASVVPGDFLHHPNPNLFNVISGGTLAGFMLSGNTIVAHELVHRRKSPIQLLFGRLILSINGDSQFEIAHVFGHHMNVATSADPATARRGETLYRFFVRSTTGQYAEAILHERKRLARIGKPFTSTSNVVVTGLLGSFVCDALMYVLGGAAAASAYLFTVVYAKFMLETVNYIQHYGLVRTPGARVEPRHSWDCMRAACTATFYALPRHSHHHAKPVHPFWELHVTLALQGVSLRWGYLGSMLMAMVPPLWFRATTPVLLHWDRQLAADDEKALVRVANQCSGLRALVNSTTANPA